MALDCIEQELPSAAEPWLPFFGPYDKHLTADFGAPSAGLSLFVLVAAVRAERALVGGKQPS